STNAKTRLPAGYANILLWMDTQIVRGSLPQMQGVIRSKQRRSVFHLIAGAFAMTDILRRSWAMISDGAKPIDWLILIVDCLIAGTNQPANPQIVCMESGRSFPIEGSQRESYQKLAAQLSNLRSIIEKPEAYF